MQTNLKIVCGIMAYQRQDRGSPKMKPDVAVRLYSLASPAIAETIAKLRARYGKYALPDPEARKVVDKAMASRTLTEELYAMREG